MPLSLSRCVPLSVLLLLSQHDIWPGPLPFGSSSDDKVQLFKEILEAPLKISRGVSDDTAVSVLSGLLDRRPEFRCGARGSKEIKEHVYFHGFLWNHLVTRSLPPPWRPDEHRVKESWVKAESIVENEKGRRISFTGEHIVRQHCVQTRGAVRRG